MSSRGAVTSNGHVPTNEYETSHKVHDAKVLRGKGGNHGLPDYSHSPKEKYIKENPDGSFRELREYGDNKKAIIEIAYHGEKSITGNRHEKVLHFHTFDDNLVRSNAKPITEEMKNRYAKYLRRYGLYD